VRLLIVPRWQGSVSKSYALLLLTPRNHARRQIREKEREIAQLRLELASRGPAASTSGLQHYDEVDAHDSEEDNLQVGPRGQICYHGPTSVPPRPQDPTSWDTGKVLPLTSALIPQACSGSLSEPHSETYQRDGVERHMIN
jgi:hypothetical protein